MADMQQFLSFLELEMEMERPAQQLWVNLDHEQQQTVIEKLSRLISKATYANGCEQEDSDD